MPKRKFAKKQADLTVGEAAPTETGSDPGQVGPRSAGRSGDNQGLTREELATSESVEELNDTDQSLEAGIVEGVEEAADHPEEPVPDPEKHYHRKPAKGY